MTTAIADLNILGNPQIYKDPNSNTITIALNATGVVVTITPIAGYNNSNTQTTNSAITSALVSLGFTVVYGVSTITLSSSTLSSSVLTSYAFVIKNGANTTLETQTILIEILSPVFVYAQSGCTYCVTFNPTESNTFSGNSGFITQGKLSYIFVDSLGLDNPLVDGLYNENVSNCTCKAGTNIVIKTYLTIRQFNDNISPVLFQAIKLTTPITITEYEPLSNFEANFDCCVSIDKGILVTPVTLTPNNSSPHNANCSNKIALQYIITDPTDHVVPVYQLSTGTITAFVGNPNITGTSTVFSTLPVGMSLYDNNDNLIGVIGSITSDTVLVLAANSLLTYSGVFNQDKNYFLNPTNASILNYPTTSLGVYKVSALYRNCCDTFTTSWVISICKSYIINSGTCNNPTVNNISAVNFLRVTLSTYNSLSLTDSVTQQIIYNQVLISPQSTFVVDKLLDNFYQLLVEELDPDGTVIGTETQILLYDCYIKTCEVELIQDVLCFQESHCPNPNDYQKKNFKLMKFFAYRDIIYSYWNSIKEQESIPSSWDIENHLQELVTYTETLNAIKEMCSTCQTVTKGCFNTQVIYNTSSDCGCTKNYNR